MTNDTPSGFIANQPLTNPPIAIDNTLVDDPAVLVDGAALVGSQTTIAEDIRGKVETPVPSIIIDIYR